MHWSWIGVLFIVYLSLGCQDLPTDLCPRVSASCKCKKVNDSVLCCHLTSDLSFKNAFNCAGISRRNNDTRHVIVKNSSIDYLDASNKLWSQLDTLTITGGRIRKVVGWFKGSLSCVNLSTNAILNEIDPKAFASLSKLTFLDLSNNNLTKLPNIATRLPNLTLDISGNSHMSCVSLKEFMTSFKNTSTHLDFNNYNNSFCLSAKSFHWFNSTEVVPLMQLELILRLEEDCSKVVPKCHCSPKRLDMVPGRPPTFTVRIDCCGLNLTELPEKLLPNTVVLNVSNNNITSLGRLSDGDTYQDVREFYADNNKIDSILPLEGSRFIEEFTVLSLRDNLLKSIPIYILSYTFDRNGGDLRFVNLAGNKLHCDCSTAQTFKMWLVTNKAHITDYEHILCEQDLEKVIYLDQNKVCIYRKDWTDYIYYIIAGEVLLLILLVSKVTYDYWVFKTSGYLPWPASKMPKLPCDWVFES